MGPGYWLSYTKGIFHLIPQVTKQLTEEQAADVEKLLEKIEEDDDVQNVYHTMEEVSEA